MIVTHAGFDSFSPENYELPSYLLDPDYRKESNIAMQSEWSLKEKYSRCSNTLWEHVKRIAYYIYLYSLKYDP